MMPLWAFLVFVALIIGAYILGRSDGRLLEQENVLFDRLDRAIAKISPARRKGESR